MGKYRHFDALNRFSKLNSSPNNVGHPYLCIAALFKSLPAYDTTQVLMDFKRKNVFILEMLYKIKSIYRTKNVKKNVSVQK